MCRGGACGRYRYLSYDRFETKNFYPGSDGNYYDEDKDFSYKKQKHPNPSSQAVVQPSVVNGCEPLSFWPVFKNITIRNNIWNHVHRPLYPYLQYQNIHSIHWILKHNFINVLVDKVKRNEYLNDINTLAEHISVFEEISDKEFFIKFNETYKRYLVSKDMEPIKNIIQSKLSVTSTTTTTTTATSSTSISNNTTTSTPSPQTTNNDDQQQTNTTSNEKNTKKRKLDQIKISDKDSNVKVIKSEPVLQEGEMPFEQLYEMYTNSFNFRYFKKALESKHFQLGKYVLDNYKKYEMSSYGSISVGDKEIIDYLVKVNKGNHMNLRIKLKNIYNRPDFEEIIQIFEKEKMVKKEDAFHMDYFLTKKNFNYFLANGYSHSMTIYSEIQKGTPEQVSVLPILLTLFKDDINYLIPYSRDNHNEYAVLRAIVGLVPEDQYSTRKIPSNYPNRDGALAKFELEYNPTASVFEKLERKDIPDSEVERLVSLGNYDFVKLFLNKFYTTGQLNNLNISTIIQTLVSGAHLHILEMMYKEFPTIFNFHISGKNPTNLVSVKQLSLYQYALSYKSLEMVDFLIDKLQYCDQSSLQLVELCSGDALLLSYLYKKKRPGMKTSIIFKKDITNYEKKHKVVIDLIDLP